MRKRKLISLVIAVLSMGTLIACAGKEEKKVKSSSSYNHTKIDNKKIMSESELSELYEKEGLSRAAGTYKEENYDVIEFNAMQGSRRLNSKRAGIIMNGNEVIRTFANVDSGKHSLDEFKSLAFNLLDYTLPGVDMKSWIDYIIPIIKENPDSIYDWEIPGVKRVQISYHDNEYVSNFMLNVVDFKHSPELEIEGIIKLGDNGRLQNK